MTPDIPTIAAGLSEAQRRAVRMSAADEHLMGGFYGLSFAAPQLVETYGLNHPIFGSHYRLTQLGLAVRAYLQEQAK